MCKTKIFQDSLSAVLEVTELERDQVLSGCKQEEVVDARALLVKAMSDKGLYPSQICQVTGICLRSVTKFLIGFSDRKNSRTILRLNYEEVKNKLGIA